MDDKDPFDYGRLFAHSWHIIRRVRFLWLLSLVAEVGGIGSTLLRLWLGQALPTFPPDFNRWLAQPGVTFLPEIQPERLRELLLWGGAGLFAAAVFVWLTATLAEGALIAGVLGVEAGQAVTLRQALARAWRWLGRFIAIDTLLFFPWFLLLLLMMFIGLAAVVASALLAAQNSSFEAMLVPLIGAALCLLLLGCLLLPVTLGTLWLRTLAFRDAAVCGHNIRTSISHTWHTVRRHAATFFILAVLLWGGQYLFSTLLGGLTLPLLLASGPVRQTAGHTGGSLLLVVVLAATAALQALVHAFTATAWTLAYRRMVEGEC